MSDSEAMLHEANRRAHKVAKALEAWSEGKLPWVMVEKYRADYADIEQRRIEEATR